MAKRRSLPSPNTRRDHARAGLNQPNAIKRLQAVLADSEFDTAASKSLEALLSLDSKESKQLDAIWVACAYVISRKLRHFYPRVFAAMKDCPDLAVRGVEFISSTCLDPQFTAEHLLAKLALLSALRSESVWVSHWNTWYFMLINAPEEEVASATLDLAPEEETFFGLQDSQRLAWLSKRHHESRAITTEEEDKIVSAVLARKLAEHDSERGMAMLVRARSEYTQGVLRESEFERMLLSFLKTPGTSHSLRSHAIVALGLRGAKSQKCLSHLYPLYRENPFNLGGISAQAIARIAADSNELPHQLDFCWHGGEDGRVAVLGTLLDSTLKGVPTFAAEAIEASPHGLSLLGRRLAYLAETCKDANTPLFARAAAAVSE